MLIDLDDTILAAGERPTVLLQIARELAADLAPHPPHEVADRLEAALELFWSDPARHRAARFGVNEARRQVMVETFLDSGSPTLTGDLAARFAGRAR
jgi:putative hydrolase of the HAD superfamily